MRILVVGAGSTGGYFGGRLAQAGRDITLLVRPARAAQLREKGLEIRSPNGDVTLHPNIITADEIAGPYDAILLTVKAFALESALEDFAPAVGPETLIMPFLNGMKHMDILVARFGAEKIIGGTCKVATTLDAEGRVVQLTQLQSLAYGELNRTVTPRITALHAALSGAGFDASLSENIEREMWEKWILLASLGAITCLMRGNIGQVANAPGGVAFATAVIDECVAITRATGQTPLEAVINGTKTFLTDPKSPMTSSMYRDLTQNRPVEADQILGDFVARAQQYNTPTPLLAAAFTQLSVYANRQRG